MKHVMLFVAMAGFWCSLVSLGFAEDKKVEGRRDASANAGVQAQIHRTMADLIEAQSAEVPEPAKIDQLTETLQQLRGQLPSQPPAGMRYRAAAGACPWGGAGMGFGRGAAWGRPGRGPGAGRGAGLGPGWGRGQGGAGGGFGPGRGLGLAPGGPRFVDQDGDGVCDHYQLRHGVDE